jgi:TetR/AcrR family transcriptional regulator, cholesterol catabolism regulator
MEIRERILKETGDLFVRNGIKNVTMDTIANHMGISKRTIYENFKDKDDLVESVILAGAAYHKSQCFKHVEESSNVIEAIFKIGKTNHNTFGRINPLFFIDLKKYHFNTYNKLVEHGDFRDTRLTYTLLERGQSEGLFRANLNINLVNVFLHKMFRIVHDEEFASFDRDDLYESLFLSFWIGISTKKGQEVIDMNLVIFQK